MQQLNPARYKIISYLAAWLVALFVTDPNGGLWALAWMFPFGVAAFINPHRGQQWRLGSVWGLRRNLSCSRLFLLPLPGDALSVRRPYHSAHLQCLGVPSDVQGLLNIICRSPRDSVVLIGCAYASTARHFVLE